MLLKRPKRPQKAHLSCKAVSYTSPLLASVASHLQCPMLLLAYVEITSYVTPFGSAQRSQQSMRLRPPAHNHRDPALRIELHEHVRSLIHGPQVVLRIDSQNMREYQAI